MAGRTAPKVWPSQPGALQHMGARADDDVRVGGGCAPGQGKDQGEDG